MAEPPTPQQKQHLEQMLAAGFTRTQALRHLAYERGEDISDVVGVVVKRPDSSAETT